MSQFIQLHLLTSYPPANLNRDDLGRPKTAVMGGTLRLRISSQSLKRAWRCSDIFAEALSEYKGTRTKLVGVKVYGALLDKGVDEKEAHDWAKQITEKFGKPEGKDKTDRLKDLKTSQLVHISPEEWKNVFALSDKLASEKRAPKDDELILLREKVHAADIALFGRMVADAPRYNVEAAAQVAHAITIHRVEVEDDYFTAVDDLNEGREDAGTAHIGEIEFAAGLFYIYVCINRDLLMENLEGDVDLTNGAIATLVECAATVAPTGKQNSFASRARASYLLCEKGSQQPRSLSVAFLETVRGDNILREAVKRLQQSRDMMDKAYGPCADNHRELFVDDGEGSLQDIIQFVKE